MLALLAWTLHRRPSLRIAAALAHRLGRRLPTEQPAIRVGRLLDGSRIVLDLRDHHQRQIYFYGEDEVETTALMRRLVGRGDVVLDVGANAGYYAVLCAARGAVVHAFEPQPELAAALRTSAELDGLPITVVEAACAARSGEIEFFDSGDPFYSGMATAVAGYYTLSEAGHAVRSVALDDYCRDNDLRPRLVKIDVEGYEGEVLDGFRAVLAAARPVIVCEVALDRPHADGVVRAMQEHGYAVSPVGGGPLRPELGVTNLLFEPLSG